MYCSQLIGSNQLITYIQVNNQVEQYFIAKVMMENLKKKKDLETIM